MLSKFFSVEVWIFSYPSVLTFVLGGQKNRLIETVLLSTQTNVFIKKNIFLFGPRGKCAAPWGSVTAPWGSVTAPWHMHYLLISFCNHFTSLGQYCRASLAHLRITSMHRARSDQLVKLYRNNICICLAHPLSSLVVLTGCRRGWWWNVAQSSF